MADLPRMRVRSLISAGWSHLNRKESHHDRATPKNDRGTAVTQLLAQYHHGLHPLRRELCATLPCLPGSAGTRTHPAIPAVPGAAEKGLVGVVQSNGVRPAFFLSAHPPPRLDDRIHPVPAA